MSKSKFDQNVMDFTYLFGSLMPVNSTNWSFLTKLGDSAQMVSREIPLKLFKLSQHIQEMAPKLARWSLDSLRGENELATMKTFPTDLQKVSAQFKEKKDTRTTRLFWWHLVKNQIIKIIVINRIMISKR